MVKSVDLHDASFAWVLIYPLGLKINITGFDLRQILVPEGRLLFTSASTKALCKIRERIRFPVGDRGNKACAD